MRIHAIPSVNRLTGVVRNLRRGLTIWYTSQKKNPITSRIGVALRVSGDIDNHPSGIHIAITTRTIVFKITDRRKSLIIGL